MSAAGDNRWRRSSNQGGPQQHQHQHQQQQQGPGSQAQSQPQSHSQSHSQAQQQSQTQAQRQKAPFSARDGGGGVGNGNPVDRPDRGDNRARAPAPSLSEEQHVPVREFNSGETRHFLRAGFREFGDKRIPSWKPRSDSGPVKSGSPWATKPNAMASGQDFWVQLRKQVSALEKGNAPA